MTFNESEKIEDRFDIKISGIQYDKKYIFSELGYNFLPSEISAAFAKEQIKKLKANKGREKNFYYLKKFFSNHSKYFKLPEVYPKVKTPWLAFPLVIKENKKFNRSVMKYFMKKIMCKLELYLLAYNLFQILKNLKYKLTLK